MSDLLLQRKALAEVRPRRGQAVDAATLRAAAEIVEDVRIGGAAAVRAHAERLGDLHPGAALVLEPGAMKRALDSLARKDRLVLERTAGRIADFAAAQRRAV